MPAVDGKERAKSTWLREHAYMGFKEDFDVPTVMSNIPRFCMLVCGMFCSVAISSVYAFSLLTPILRTKYHFTQNDITTVSTLGWVIGYLTFPFGLIYDYMGPKPVLAIGIVLNVSGTLLFALVFNGTVPANVGGIAMINAIQNLGCSLYDMGCILTILSWFPLDRGFVIACLKTMIGLGSSLVATVYATYFFQQFTTYMFCLMAYCLLMGLIALVIVYLPPFHMTGRRMKNYDDATLRRAADYESLYMAHKAPIKRFGLAFIILFATLIVVSTRSVVFVFLTDPTTAQKQVTAVLSLGLFALMLLVPISWGWLDKQPPAYEQLFGITTSDVSSRYEEGEEHEEEGDGSTNNTTNNDSKEEDHGVPAVAAGVAPDAEELVGEALVGQVKEGSEKELSRSPDSEEYFSQLTSAKDVRRALRLATETEKVAPQFPTGFFYNVRRPTLICMWVTGFCSFGVVMVVMMNVAEVYIAISEDPSDQMRPALYVALTGIGSAIGRIAVSFAEAWTLTTPTHERVPVTIFYIVPPSVCLVSIIMFLVIPPAGLLLPMLLVGFANGFYAACETITARTIFSIDISKHYNSLFFFEMLSLIFLNRLLFGELVTKNSTENADGSHVCIGRKKCIQTTFIVLTFVSAVGIAAGTCVYVTYRNFARKEHTKRAAHRARLEDLLQQLEAKESSKQE